MKKVKVISEYERIANQARATRNRGTSSLASTPIAIFGTNDYSASGFQNFADRVAKEFESSVAVIEMPKLESIHTASVETVPEDLMSERQRLAMEAELVLGYRGLRMKTAAPSRLQMVLAKLEIDVWNAAEVQKYKSQMAAHFRTTHKMFDPTWEVTPIEEYTAEIPDYVVSKAIEVKKELPDAEFFVEHFREDPFLLVSIVPSKPGEVGRHGTLGKRAVDEVGNVAYLDVWDEHAFEDQHA